MKFYYKNSNKNELQFNSSTTGELKDASTGRGGELREGLELSFQEGN